MRTITVVMNVIIFSFVVLMADFTSGLATGLLNEQTPFLSLPEGQRLTQNSVRSMVQDERGFLWVGTLGGLHRYDGKAMVLVNELDLGGTALVEMRISALAVADGDLLWVGGSYGSLDLVHTAAGRVEHFSDLTVNNGKINLGRIYEIIPTGAGGVWVGDRVNIYRIDCAEHTIRQVPVIWPAEALNSRIIDFLPLADGTILFTAWNQVGLLDPVSGAVRFLTLEGYVPVEGGGLFGVSRLSDGSVWVFGENSSLYQLVKSKGAQRLQRYILPVRESHAIRDVMVVPGGAFWFRIGGNGLASWNIISNEFLLIDSGLGEAGDRQEVAIHTFMCDRSGVLWLGTEGHGVRFRDPSRCRFNRMGKKTLSPTGFADPYLWQLCEDSESIVVMGRRELLRFDPSTANVLLLLDIFAHPETAHRKGMNTFVPLGGGRWLIGFRDCSVGTYDQSDGSFRLLAPYMELLSAAPASYICTRMERDTNGRVWIFTTLGTLVYNPVTGNIISPPTILNQELGVSQVRVMLEDRAGSFWFGTEHSGLIYYDPRHDTVTSWRSSGGDGELAYPGVRAIHEGENGDVWVGTHDGLNVLRASERREGGRHLDLFTVEDGLPNNTIYSILPGAEGELWIATNVGLSRYRENLGTWTNYDRRDGMANNEFNGGASLRSHDGDLLFGGIEGLTWFRPEELVENRVLPLVAMTHVSNFTSVLCNFLAVPGLERVSLAWDENNIEIELSTLDFQQPGGNKVAYRVSGLEDEWRQASVNQQIHLTNLPAGSQVFEYKGGNNDGVWSDINELRIDVAKPPWRTARAWALYVLIVVSLTLVFAIRTRRSQLQKKRTTEQMIVADKFKVVGFMAGGLAHDFNNILQVILGHTTLAQRKISADHPAQRSLDNVAGAGGRARLLVQRLLSFAHDSEQEMEVIDLDGIVLGLLPILQSFMSNEIEVKFEQGPAAKFVNGNADRLEQVLTNLCLNARDAIDGVGAIIIRTERGQESASGNWHKLSVIDSGKGISSQDIAQIFEPFFTTKGTGMGTGLGLSIVYNIVTGHGGLVSVDSILGQETTFEVSLPAVPARADGLTTVPLDVLGDSKADGNVLLADDDLSVRELTATILTDAGYTVIQAANGVEAIEVLDGAQVVDIAVIDVVMPIKGGRAVYDHIKLMGMNIPVLFCTGFGFEKFSGDNSIPVSTPLLAKPFEANELLLALYKLKK